MLALVKGWLPISEYTRDKYDWVLIKYYLEDGYECIPTVAEMRSDGRWYDPNGFALPVDVRYFFDMQLLDKLSESDV